MKPGDIFLLFFALLLGGNALFAQNGNVGIGTTTPAEKLDVNGNILTKSLTSTYGSYIRVDNTENVGMTLQSTMAGSPYGARGIVGTSSAHPVQLIYNASPVIFMDNGAFAPNGSNLTSLGTDANRWNTVYAGGAGVNAKNVSTQYVGFTGESQGGVTSTFTSAAPGSAFGADGYVLIGSFSNHKLAFVANNAPIFYMDALSIFPNGNNNKQLGYANAAFSQVFAYNFNNPSDIRFKKNIDDLKYGINDIMKMRSVVYDLKDNKNEKKMIGFIAQEVEKIIPEIVSTDPDSAGYKSIDYVKLIPILIKGIQEQETLIASQKNQLKDLQAQIEIQNQAIASLKAQAINDQTVTALAREVQKLKEAMGILPTVADNKGARQ